MGTPVQDETMEIDVSTISGLEFTAESVPRTASWGETLRAIRATVDLPEGPGTSWSGRTSEGRIIQEYEINEEVFHSQPRARVSLEPEVSAGRMG